MLPGELEYIRHSWAESAKPAPRTEKLSWREYKAFDVPKLASILERPDTRILVAPLRAYVAGWIAFVPGRRVSTVHWVHTRFVTPDGERCRKRRVMAALLTAAQLGDRIVYTHKGPVPKNRRDGRVPSDEWIVPWLAKHGVTAAFVPMKEWET